MISTYIELDTPPSIDYETERFSEITDTLSRLRLGEQDQQGSISTEDPLESINSKSAVMNLNLPVDPAQRAENLLTNIATIYGEPDDEMSGPVDHGVTDTEAAERRPETETCETDSRNEHLALAQGTVTRSSRRRGKERPHIPDTPRPGAYSPSLSEFDWWETFGKWSSSRSVPLYALNDESIVEGYSAATILDEQLSRVNKILGLQKWFQGFIIERNTYANEMSHREQAHHHFILATEAGISMVDQPQRSYVISTVLLPIMLIGYRNKYNLQGSVCVPWCVSEGLRSVILNLFTFSNWRLILMSLRQISSVLCESEKNNMFNSFLGLATFSLSRIDITQAMQHSDSIYGPRFSATPDENWPGGLQRMKIFVDYFDPSRPSMSAVSEQALPDNFTQGDGCRYLKYHKNSLPELAFRLVTAIRYVQQTLGNPGDFESIKSLLPTLHKEFRSPDGNEDMVWTRLWCFARCPPDISQRGGEDPQIMPGEPVARQFFEQAYDSEKYLVNLWASLGGQSGMFMEEIYEVLQMCSSEDLVQGIAILRATFSHTVGEDGAQKSPAAATPEASGNQENETSSAEDPQAFLARFREGIRTHELFAQLGHQILALEILRIEMPEKYGDHHGWGASTDEVESSPINRSDNSNE